MGGIREGGSKQKENNTPQERQNQPKKFDRPEKTKSEREKMDRNTSNNRSSANEKPRSPYKSKKGEKNGMEKESRKGQLKSGSRRQRGRKDLQEEISGGKKKKPWGKRRTTTGLYNIKRRIRRKGKRYDQKKKRVKLLRKRREKKRGKTPLKRKTNLVYGPNMPGREVSGGKHAPENSIKREKQGVDLCTMKFGCENRGMFSQKWEVRGRKKVEKKELAGSYYP